MAPTSEKKDDRWDLFISHASEDKNDFVRPLAKALERFGTRVWYDEYELRLGDSLSQSIDKGLARSDYGLVILSPAFFKKSWPEYELRGLITREVSNTKKIILPVWHNITQTEICNFSPTLADKLAIRSNQSAMVEIAAKIIQVVRPDLFTKILRRIAHYKFTDTAPVVELPLSEIKPGLIQHPSLPPDLIGRIRLVRASLLEVYEHPMPFWLDGFQRDSHPSREVEYWEHVASVYLEYFSKEPSTNFEKKKQVFSFILLLGMKPSDAELTKAIEALPEGTADIILGLYTETFPSDFEMVELINTPKKHDIEYFPKDLPEDLIRELMKLNNLDDIIGKSGG